jgi:hypothetical protein
MTCRRCTVVHSPCLYRTTARMYGISSLCMYALAKRERMAIPRPSPVRLLTVTLALGCLSCGVCVPRPSISGISPNRTTAGGNNFLFEGGRFWHTQVAVAATLAASSPILGGKEILLARHSSVCASRVDREGNRIRVLATADCDCVDSDGAGNTGRVILRRIEHKHEHHPRVCNVDSGDCR